MPAGDAMLWVGSGVLALACAAAAIAWLLRRSGIPGGRVGAAVVGGILAGVLLGPGVGGRVAPRPFEHAFVGGASERLDADEMAGRHRREREVVEAAGVTPEYVTELSASQAAEIAPLAQAAATARAARQAELGAVAGAVFAAHALMVGLVCGPIGRRMRRNRAHRERAPADATGAAGMMVVVAMVTPILVLMWVLRAPVREAIGVALAMAVPAIGGEARTRLLPTAAIGIAMSAAGVAYLAWNGTAIAAPGAVLPVGGAVLAMIALVVWGGVRTGRAARRWIGWTLVGATLPLIAALATMRCDPHALIGSRAFWIVAITAVLFSSDGRWVGIGWAQKLFPKGTGRSAQGIWSGASAMVNAGTGAAQLATGLVLESAGVVSREALAGLVLGAAAIELSRGIRMRVGLMMDRGAT